MKHPYHNLLPIYMQEQLMQAAATGSIERIDSVAEDLRDAAPKAFLSEKSIARRMFYHEPRQSVPMAGFVVPFRGGLTPATIGD